METVLAHEAKALIEAYAAVKGYTVELRNEDMWDKHYGGRYGVYICRKLSLAFDGIKRKDPVDVIVHQFGHHKTEDEAWTSGLEQLLKALRFEDADALRIWLDMNIKEMMK